MKIQILTDHPGSWMVSYASTLNDMLIGDGHQSVHLFRHEEVKAGDILLMLSCEKIFNQLHLNRMNLVVHESALPKGRGWSPLTWQIIEGAREIPVTLFEASEKVDAGPVYLSENIHFDGTELIEELRKKQAEATIRLVRKFCANPAQYPPVSQEGEPSYYRKRTPEDARLNPDLSIASQINLLRISDNERYPAFFELNGSKYLLKIYKASE
jgi:methionyl-tRNA formyltransferase